MVAVVVLGTPRPGGQILFQLEVEGVGGGGHEAVAFYGDGDEIGGTGSELDLGERELGLDSLAGGSPGREDFSRTEGLPRVAGGL